MCCSNTSFLKILIFCQLQEYSVVSLWPKNQSSISYGFIFNTVFGMKDKMFLLSLRPLDKPSK